MVVGQTTVVGE